MTWQMKISPIDIGPPTIPFGPLTSNHYGHHPRIIHTPCRLTRNPASTLGAPRKDTGNVRLLTVVMILMGFLVSGTIHTYRRIARASAVVMILMGFLDSGTIHPY